jgi:hypothetical protein
MNDVRRNPYAIAVASLLYFMLGGVWFTVFQKAWLTGVGRTLEQLQQAGVSPAFGYCVAIATTILIAIALDWVIQATGPQTVIRGLKVAFLLWLCFIFTTFAAEYAFEVRSLQIFAINAGYPLAGMLLMGMVLGAWKKKVSV